MSDTTDYNITGRQFFVGASTAAGASVRGVRKANLFATVNDALAKCVADRGDVVTLLPGHVAAITAADMWSSLVAGVTIQSVPGAVGNQRAIVRWSAAAGTLLMDQAGTVLRNLRLQMAGDPSATTALTVAAPITCSAAGCAVLDCDWQVGVDADQIVTVAFTTTAAANDLRIERNRIIGAVAAEITAAGTVIRLVGADGAVIRDNYIAAALATDTDGLIETITTLSDNLDISRNFFYSNGAGSTCALDFGQDLVNSGQVRDNLLVVDADGTAVTVALTQHANSNLALLDNFMVSNNGERGLVIGTAST